MKKSLADRLELLEAKLGIKKLDFARRTRFSQSYISMVFNGSKTSPSERFYDAVCREFGVNIEWLKNGKGEMFAKPNLTASSLDTEIMVKLRLLPLQEQKIIQDIIDTFLAKK